jgi:hypothetical protein
VGAISFKKAALLVKNSRRCADLDTVVVVCGSESGKEVSLGCRFGAVVGIAAGWELFAEHVDSDIVDAVFAIHRDRGERLGGDRDQIALAQSEILELGVAVQQRHVRGSTPPASSA